MWKEPKSLLHHQHLDLKTFKAGKDRVWECLVEILLEAWDAVSKDFLESLLVGMPHWVQAVLDADGWYT
jgi:hypothetical protein